MLTAGKILGKISKTSFVETLGREFLKYLVVGGLAFLVDFSLLIGLVEVFKLNLFFGASLAFAAGILVNFVLSRSWVFKNKANQPFWLEFTLFTAIGLIGLVLNNVSLWVLTTLLGVFYILSKLISVALVLICNFGLRKWILY